jgi:hypothetical protein
MAGVAAGLVAWMLFATLANMALRAALPGYAEAEPAMKFTLAMMMARLLVGGASCAVAGWVAARIAKGSGWTAWVLGVALIAMFIPVHIGWWDRFPAWYHVTFLASLLPLTLLGAMLAPRRRPIAGSLPR